MILHSNFVGLYDITLDFCRTIDYMLSFFPRGLLDKILNLIESVSEGFPSYIFLYKQMCRIF